MGVSEWIRKIDDVVWGWGLLAVLLGSSLYLTVKLKCLPIRRCKQALGYAIKKEERSMEKEEKDGRISSFSALTTELAATIGTGNIVGVATAMTLGGPGALFWMVVVSLLGMATKLTESTLAVKYRKKNENGQVVGGPMYVLENEFPLKRVGHLLAVLFSLFAVLASLGMGNMVQANSIAEALLVSFSIPKETTGFIITLITIFVVLGGIGVIGRVTGFLVPFMGVLYMLGTAAVILVYWRRIPEALEGIVMAAFHPGAVSGGIFGEISASAFGSIRWGISRGVFSNEAGLGASGISACAADTKDYIRQGYISMTGVFLDTVVICVATGLALAVSGVFGETDSWGNALQGMDLTLAAYGNVFGSAGERFISICIVLFALATIVAWAYQGEKAFEFLMHGKSERNVIYRFLFAMIVFVGSVCPLKTVWDLSDICNGLMAVPNLICVLVLSKGICLEIISYDKNKKKN